MKLLLATLALCSLASSQPAAAHRPPPRATWVDVRLDCEGSPCSEVGSGGQRYVIGRQGQRYTITLSNPSDRWVEAVVTVDGRNILDGDRPHGRSRGYLIPPRDRVEVEGWRVSRRDVAAFRFTNVSDSYAGRVGDGGSAGQVRVEVYPELEARTWIPEPEPWLGIEDSRDAPAKRSPAPEASTGDGRPAPEAMTDVGRALRERYDDDGRHLGTQYGESRWQPIEERHFERASDRPSQVVTLNYDDRAGLIARGIIGTPRWRVDDDYRWVPPPPDDDYRWVPPPG